MKSLVVEREMGKDVDVRGVVCVRRELEGENEKAPFVTVEYEREDENGFNKISIGDIGKRAEVRIVECEFMGNIDLKLEIKTNKSVFRVNLSNEAAEILIEAVKRFVKRTENIS